MPRKRRIHYHHAFYHVMLRGNYRQNIFFDESDRLTFYRILNHVVQQFNCKIHLFCLMTNHIHMVIQVTHIPLYKIMLSLSSCYTKIVNKRINRQGHLFQGRYQANLVQDDTYLLELCYYIHNNPIKANMVRHIDNYPWSSHQAYLGKQHFSWLTTTHIKMLLKNHVETSKDPYQVFMTEREKYYRKPKFCHFDESGQLIINDSINKQIRSRPLLDLKNIPLKQIAAVVCDYTDVNIRDLDSVSQARNISLARSIIAYFAHYHAHHLLADIAALYSRNPNTVSIALQRFLKKLKQNPSATQLMKRIETKLLVSDINKLKF